jgi:SanA protein
MARVKQDQVTPPAPRVLPGNARRRRVRLGLLAIALIATVCTCGRLVEDAARDRVFDDVNQTSPRRVGIVLGASRTLASGQTNLFYLSRVNAAADLYRARKVEYLIVSGDNHTRDYNEPATMKTDLIARGVPAERIYRDYAGFRTLDSMVRAKQVFGLDQCIVVSQKFHCERAIFLASSCGLDAIGLAAPDVTAPGGWRTHLREYAARVAAVLDADVWHRSPKFLGEPIRVGVDPPT